MSRRLTKVLRAEIAQNAVDHAMPDKLVEDLREKKRELGDKIYNSLVSATDLKNMDRLPEKFFITGKGFHAYMGESRRFRRRYVELTGTRLLPAFMHISYPNVDEKFDRMMGDLDDQIEAEASRKHNAKQKIIDSISGITTVKKLLEVWPEVCQFIPAAENPQLPAVRTKELNEMLGL